MYKNSSDRGEGGRILKGCVLFMYLLTEKIIVMPRDFSLHLGEMVWGATLAADLGRGLSSDYQKAVTG